MQNAAKTLFANIRFMSPDKPIKSIVVTSSAPDEGKTTISLNLAQAIATSGKSTLLVEADMRRRSLANALQLRPQHGTYALLTGQATLNDAVVQTAIKPLFFLDIEPNIPNPADILASGRYRKLVEKLRNSFDYVIFDTPPVNTFVDAAILSTLVDGTILVVRPGKTKRMDLMRSYDQLEKANANILGACANFCENIGSEYYYAYYTKSGDRIDTSEYQEEAEAQQDADTDMYAPQEENEEPANAFVPIVSPTTFNGKHQR